MLISGVAAGLVAGVLTGGDLRRLGRLRPRLAGAFVLAVLLRGLAAAPFDSALQRYVYVVALGLLVIAVVANLDLPGTVFIAAGLIANTLVISANGGAMPVAPAAVAAASAVVPSDPLHTELHSETRLAMLADVIPVALFRSVYSAGDVLLSLGVFWLIVRVSRTP